MFQHTLSCVHRSREDRRHYADVTLNRRQFTRLATTTEWFLAHVFAPELPPWCKIDDLPTMQVTRLGSGAVAREITQSTIGPIDPNLIHKENNHV